MGLFDFFSKKKDKPTPPPAKPVIKSGQFYALKVEKVVQETANAISVYLTIPTQLKEVYQYKTGQYITLKVELNGTSVLRSYSLSSSPTTDTYFRIGIKRKEGGTLSPYLVDNVKTGDTLEVFTPLGKFTPNWQLSTSHYYCFAGGSGITPLLSIIKTALKQKESAKVILFYANRNDASIMYQQELADLQKVYGERLVIHHILDTPSTNISAEKGIFKTSDYARYLVEHYENQFQNALFFTCGPTPLMQAVEKALKEACQVDSEQIYVEYFDMAQQQGVNQAALSPQQTTNVDVSKLSMTLKKGETEATIFVGKQKYMVKVPENTTVLDAVLDQGIDVPFMCEAGVCASCKARLSKGKIEMIENHSLTDREVEEGYILTCQSLPKTQQIEVKYF